MQHATYLPEQTSQPITHSDTCHQSKRRLVARCATGSSTHGPHWLTRIHSSKLGRDRSRLRKTACRRRCLYCLYRLVAAPMPAAFLAAMPAAMLVVAWLTNCGLRRLH